jgi:NADPH-dependent 2,4-dienoyl-CoA reductase/sulfur reductase-like enzyme
MSRPLGAAVDVLVVGAGPAGLSAAIAAAEQGRRVLVIDQGLRAGGQVWRHRAPESLPPTARAMLEHAQSIGVAVATGARVIDIVSPIELVVEFRGRPDRQITRALVLATGARERLMPFPGWTLPGVVGLGGLQALIKSGLSVAGARIVIAGSGPLIFPVAALAARAGGEIVLVAEQASLGAVLRFGAGLATKPAAMIDAVRYRWAFRAARWHTGSWVEAAEGFGAMQRAMLRVHGRSVTVDCDWLATGMGLVPATDLAQLAGCTLTGDAVTVDAGQATTVPGVWAAGECTGIKGDAAAIAEGEVAGLAAAGGLARPSVRVVQRRNAGRRFGQRLAAAFAVRAEVRQLATDETIICRCEDVRRGDIDPAWSQRQAKLWTRVGMGECQGAVCGPACAALFGWGANAARPPLGAPLCGGWSAAIADAGDR